jgi:Tol biopolymer transport system component
MAVLMLFPGRSFSETLMPGANLVQLTTDGKSRAWFMSPRGEWITYLRDISNTQAQLRVMKVDGSEDRAVSPVGNPFFVQWSWAGDRLSYEFTSNREPGSQGNVFIYDLAEDRSYPVSQTYSYSSLMGGRWWGRGRGNKSRQDERPGLNSWSHADGPYWSVDDKFVAYSLRTSGGEEQVWVAETASGKYQRILPQRGGVQEQRWSPNTPPRLVLQLTASGRHNDVATVNADGTGLTMLTNIGGESVDNDNAAWDPTGKWIAYVSDLEMTKTEREKHCSDVWVARPDGSESRNLTQASSNSTESDDR